MRCLCPHLPHGLHHLHRQWRGKRSARAPQRAGAAPRPGSLYLDDAQDRPHHGQGRRPLPALWAVRRALPHRRLGHAEIPVERAQDGVRMPQVNAVNDFVVKFSNVNGSGSASANEMFARSILRMGVPVTSRNIFPSNIQGLPTWYEVRVSGHGWLGRRGGVDLMVAMNPQTWDKDIASIDSGGYLFYDSSRPIPASKFRDDVNIIRMPLTEISNAAYKDPRQRQLFKNIIYIGALTQLLGIEIDVLEKLIGEQYKSKEALIAPNHQALCLGFDHAQKELSGQCGLKIERADAVGDRIFVSGNDAAGLGCVYGGATVAAWYPLTPSPSGAGGLPHDFPK